MSTAAKKHRLGDLASFVSGGTPSKQIDGYWGGDTPWVSAKDLKSLRISSSIDTLSDAGKREASLVPPGTLLVLVRGMSLFKSIPLGIATRELAINQDLKGLVIKADVSPDFLAYSLLAHEDELMQMVESAGHGTGRLDTDALKDFAVRVPPRHEQNGIVEILASWDIAIEKFERLIAAKEYRHTALMIRLLGVQLWQRSRQERADALFTVVSERNRPDMPVLSVTQDQGVVPRANLDRRIMMELSDPAIFKVVRKDDFVISLRSFQGGLEHSAYDGLVSPAYTVLRCTTDLLPRFYRHYLKSPDFLKRLAVAVVGIRDGKQINFADFASIKLPLPSPERQRVVAVILDESEQEIVLLKQQVDHLRQQKRGLMQKLLTGKAHISLKEGVPA